MNHRTEEDRRLHLSGEHAENWQRWGTYLPERQWGVVREDYSADGNCWDYFPYDMARYRAYRWGEDGLLGWTDRECRLCFSTSLWNGADAHLKERFFGLSNPEGNHGEDVKELYYYLDATPTGSYAKALYKYPQKAFPYEELIRVNRERTYADSEYELLDTGIFDGDFYFDVEVEYAKNDVDDTLIRITVNNRGPEAALLYLLPTLTFRNNWSWHSKDQEHDIRPSMRGSQVDGRVVTHHATLGKFQLNWIADEDDAETPPILMTENETNFSRMGGESHVGKFSKDAFDRYLVHGEKDAIRSDGHGTKAAFLKRMTLEPGDQKVFRLRLVRLGDDAIQPMDAAAVDSCFSDRQQEVDIFYADRISSQTSEDDRNIARQAYAGLLWSKQFYYYVADQWMRGDEAQPRPPASRLNGRNAGWQHMYCRDVLSVPDKWEYPWFAAWDSAFHMIPMADLDPDFAKHQLLLLLREWYMHPNGQLAAYEFAFSDSNPPVHAWAALQVYRRDAARRGKSDSDFLERCFQKLLMNFTWWVNREDPDGQNLFGGGFLGLDNIGVYDRSLPTDGTRIEQADGTAWMGFYCISMLNIALELAKTKNVYEDLASKFLEHFVAIVEAINQDDGKGLWDDKVGFYFDCLRFSDGTKKQVAIRSIVGLIPLCGVTVLRHADLEHLPGFVKRMNWFLKHRPHLGRHIKPVESKEPQYAGDLYLSIVPRDRIVRVLACMFDEGEFLSDHGIRSLSRHHEENPYMLKLGASEYEVRYLPAEGDSGLFGGNSNWRGPVWLPINKLLLDSIEQYAMAFGDEVKWAFPTGTRALCTLQDILVQLENRIVGLFRRQEGGERAVHGGEDRYAVDPHWNQLVLFSEYFCGDTGRGIGASHQTGWTSLVATLIAHADTQRSDCLVDRARPG